MQSRRDTTEQNVTRPADGVTPADGVNQGLAQQLTALQDTMVSIQSQLRRTQRQLLEQQRGLSTLRAQQQQQTLSALGQLQDDLQETRALQQDLKAVHERIDVYFAVMETIVGNQDRIQANQGRIIANQMKIKSAVPDAAPP